MYKRQVDGGTGGIGAVAHKDEVFFGSFLALCRGVVAVPEYLPLSLHLR